MTDLPQKILSTTLPSLIHAAKYARFIQNSIQALEEKEGSTNIFQAALSDADLTIQAQIEVVLLAEFPEIPFFGEEYKSSRNTRYLKGLNFVDGCDYLITLDPIDGTRPYIDGHDSFQVILTVCSRETFEAVIVVYPATKTYMYALKSKGVFHGDFSTPFEAAKKYGKPNFKNNIYIYDPEPSKLSELRKIFDNVYSSSQYSKDTPIPYFNTFMHGQIRAGAFESAQVIDGAAFAFIAQEMGAIVETYDGKPFPRIADSEELILPGLIIGDTKEVVDSIRRIIA